MDFDVSTSQRIPREFLAVVLAGFGNELVPLTSDHGEEPCAKALLPIANRPVLEYSLSWLEQSGIRDILLICPVSHRPAISHYVHSSSSFTSLRIDLQTYDESQDDLSTGTCAVLRHFSSRIQEDFIILPCDFIPPPSLPLTVLLNKFRSETISDGSIATTCWFAGHRTEKGSIPDEWGSSSSITPIVWDDSTGTLLHIETSDSLDSNTEELELRMALLTKYPRTRLSSLLQDSHVYICRRSVLDALQEKPHMDSLREEFLPWLCKIQYQRTRRNKYGQVLDPSSNDNSQTMALKHSTMHSDLLETDRGHAFFPPGRTLNGLSLSVPTSPVDSEDELPAPASLRVGVIIIREDAGFASRVNNLSSYLEANRHFLAPNSYSLPTDPENRSLIDQKAQISPDSMIGDSTKVEERASIKKSIIGKHCVIGKMAKVVGSVILDHCVISDGAKIESCILGKNTKIGAKAELSKCVTQAGYEVNGGDSYKNEKLDVSDWTAAPIEDSEESEGESSESSDR